ncbi:MAG: UDP-N-acetylmuramate dehydrogenase [Pseudomonadota bacterium]
MTGHDDLSIPLIDRMPAVRGRLAADRPMAQQAWLRVGGPAEVFFQPADAEDLAAFLVALPTEIPVTPVGRCSNLIIRDGGLPGVVVRLGAAFGRIEVLEGHRLRVGAAAADASVATKAAAEGIGRLGFLRTIPGSIGGAVRMNAGCYGTYTADVVESVTMVTRAGEILTLDPAACGFAYRDTALPAGIVVSATLRGAPAEPAALEAEMAGFLAKRAASQPTDELSCGSTFRNPAGFSSTGREDDTHELKAWKLIDDAGCRGLTLGGARMSEKHSNFLTNTGNATAQDLETLGEAVRQRVKAQSGHDLVWEIQRIGVTLAPT